MKFAIYARVSTADKGQDPEVQLRDLREYAKARGWTVSAEYVDIGQSGIKDSRPELNRLMDDARKRRIDGIFVWKLDRFSRSLKHLVNTLDELNDRGVVFVSYKENLDLSTSAGKLMSNILGSFAQFERDLISERVRAGLQNAKAKGKRLGRPGISDEQEAEIRELRAGGKSIRDIAGITKLSKSVVHSVLKRGSERESKNH